MSVLRLRPSARPQITRRLLRGKVSSKPLNKALRSFLLKPLMPRKYREQTIRLVSSGSCSFSVLSFFWGGGAVKSTQMRGNKIAAADEAPNLLQIHQLQQQHECAETTPHKIIIKQIDRWPWAKQHKNKNKIGRTQLQCWQHSTNQRAEKQFTTS